MVSTKGRYALTVMLDLAENQGEGYVSLSDIANRQALPMKYLEILVSTLNKGGMVASRRGKKGGYRLVKEPEDYSVYEILTLTEGSLAPVECVKRNDHCDRATSCMTLPVWMGLDKAVEDYLSNITLKDVLDGKA